MKKRDIQKHLEMIDTFRKAPRPWWEDHRVIFPAGGKEITIIVGDTPYTSKIPSSGLPCVIGFGSPGKIVFALSVFTNFGSVFVADRPYDEGGSYWPPKFTESVIEVCPISGQIVRDNLRDCVEGEIIRAAKVSFTVAFWVDRFVTRANYQYWFIIDGSAYSCQESGVVKDGEKPRPTDSARGFSGRTFRIKKGDRVYTIDSLWHVGEIPSWARNRYPDNAEFVSSDS